MLNNHNSDQKLSNVIKIISIDNKSNSKSLSFSRKGSNLKTENTFTIYDENTKYEFIINLKKDDKLYIDGLEMLGINNIKHFDSNGYYIKGFKHDLELKLYDENNQSNKYLPGKYIIHLIRNHCDYYSWLVVNPKFLQSSEYNKLLYDLEHKIDALSMGSSFGIHGAKNGPLILKNDLKLLEIFENKFIDFRNAIFKISKNPRNEISTTHKWSKSTKFIGGLDYLSVMKMSQYHCSNNFYVKYHCINYAIPDNIKLKNELYKIKLTAYDLYKRYKDVINSFKTIRLYNYMKLIDQLFSDSWMKTVPLKFDYNPSLGNYLLNHNYLFIHNLLNQIYNLRLDTINYPRYFLFDSKPTEKLYELWGFLETIEALKTMGFIITSESLLDCFEETDSMQIVKNGLSQELPINMVLNHKMHHDFRNIKLSIIYNNHIKDKSIEEPIRTVNKHDKPDIRIHVFDAKDVFMGTIIIDTKYRNPQNVFSHHFSNNAREQLFEYSHGIFSNNIFSSDTYPRELRNYAKKHPVVESVGVMFPKINEVSDKYDKLKNLHNIISFHANPDNRQHLINFIKNSINSILSTFN
ncbi:hypothetical protein WR164_01670 [Philodulcilactobacillus myokoensis]|uniref:DUF2357 domain-containing protein n=1 Tax=Philodulcilactobacillus myokoensis TaxID=2929573 RepID=A0A9W6B011_9LACO|nr:nuclease domain-containing protein [Philodulcilactobacillus myokoensis]GLB46188.1 hypothetical protein WR164_01670 [Philodulcilactobacillus myokoensis]